MTIRWMSDEQEGESQADGLFTRKGSYGAAMTNAWFFDQVAKSRSEQPVRDELLAEIARAQMALVPVLAALGMIGFFSVEEWLDTDNEGRVLIAALHLARHRAAIDGAVRRRLEHARDRVAAPLLRAMLESLLAGRAVDLDASAGAAGAALLAVRADTLIPDGRQGRVTDAGLFYRKGTTLAAFDNCRRYDELVERADADAGAARELEHVVNDQQFITNMMLAGGFFELFPPLEWLRDEGREGRIAAAALLLQQRPGTITLALAGRLAELRPRVHGRTRLLVDETLAAGVAFSDKRERIRGAIAAIVRRYLDALSRRDLAAIAELWADDGEATLMVPGVEGWIRGRDRILEFTAANFAEFAALRRTLERIECDADPTAGIASVSASVAMEVEASRGGRYAGLAESSRALLRIELRRLPVPSCMPALRGDGDASVGEWRVRSWAETFPLAARGER